MSDITESSEKRSPEKRQFHEQNLCEKSDSDDALSAHKRHKADNAKILSSSQLRLWFLDRFG